MRGKFYSKKLAFSTFCVLVISGMAVASHWVPELAVLYQTFVGGISAIAGLYLAGDVAAAHFTKESPTELRASADIDPTL
jgi:hypothetical protein